MRKLIIPKPNVVTNAPAKPEVKIRLTFYLNGKEAEQLRQICAAEDVSVSHKIRQHVRQLLQHHHQQ